MTSKFKEYTYNTGVKVGNVWIHTKNVINVKRCLTLYYVQVDKQWKMLKDKRFKDNRLDILTGSRTLFCDHWCNGGVVRKTYLHNTNDCIFRLQIRASFRPCWTWYSQMNPWSTTLSLIRCRLYILHPLSSDSVICIICMMMSFLPL